jgi:hypothetical protein
MVIRKESPDDLYEVLPSGDRTTLSAVAVTLVRSHEEIETEFLLSSFALIAEKLLDI